MKSVRGFTLLELLVALAVFAIIAVAAYTGLQSVLRTQVAVEQQSDRLAEVQMAVYFLEQDIEQILPRPVRDEFDQRQPALQSGGLDDTVLTLTRTGWDNPLERTRAGLQRLNYRFSDDQLIRQYWPVLDRAGLSEPRQSVLLTGIDDIRLRFLDNNDQWQTSWPSDNETDPAALPRAVEVTLILDDWGPITRLLRLVG